jgi:hypothetical protein
MLFAVAVMDPTIKMIFYAAAVVLFALAAIGFAPEYSGAGLLLSRRPLAECAGRPPEPRHPVVPVRARSQRWPRRTPGQPRPLGRRPATTRASSW